MRCILADNYCNTGLWLRSLGAHDASSKEHLVKLNASYADFRTKAFQLTAQIAKTLPSLTIHDGTHLDALWETADLIAGPDYPLNSLEGFVLGGAILLHDAALCFEAFESGQEGLRATVEWKDSFAASSERHAAKDEEYILADADFAALRSLHAKQAAMLGKKAWELPSGEKLFLIEDSDLRQRYGGIIGQIAASHHWPIEEVAKLGDQINAPGTFPIEWRVDPVKIACLLRCADAAHVDNRRAPDFLYALSRKQSISADHWKAQNWLARADLNQSDEHQRTLLFTSNCDFEIEDASAWWVAYDAISLVDAEIKASNALLSSRSNKRISPPFRIEKILGANSPEVLSTYIRASGWRPCSARIHVGNLEKLVKDLGGTQLYGDSDQLSVALRELLQNARDAIAARRSIDNDFVGKIRVRLTKQPDNAFALQVEDNGVGMSERVLTGPLLDFGTSFWISNLVQEEFPGLRSSSFRSVGKFGIGFYSVFMVAAAVTVSSRRWDAGLGDIKTLDFPTGLTLRPILSAGRPESFPGSASTVVTLILKDDTLTPEGIKVTRGRIGEEDFHISMPDYLAALVCGTDVDVEFIDKDRKTSEKIHNSIQNIVTPEARLNWLRRLSFVGYGKTRVTENEVERVAQRLRYVDKDNPMHGLAALSTQVQQATTFLSVNTIGGLASTVHGRGSEQFVGFLDYLPKSAKRDATSTTAASEAALEEWAREQIKLLKLEQIDTLQWTAVTTSLCDLKLDPSDIFTVLVMIDGQLQFCSLEQIFQLAASIGVAVFESNVGNHIDTYASSHQFEHFPTYRPLMNSHFLSIERENGKPKHKNTLLGCLDRYVSSKGFALDYERRLNAAQSMFGPINVVIIKAHLDSTATTT